MQKTYPHAFMQIAKIEKEKVPNKIQHAMFI